MYVIGAHLNLAAHDAQRRIDRYVFQQPTQAASAVERPLRTAQHLNILEVAWVEVDYLLTVRDSGRGTIRDVVDRNAYAWIDEAAGRNTANRQLRDAISAGSHGQAR